MSGILIYTQQKGRLRKSVALCIHIAHAKAQHLTLFTALSCDSREQCQSKSRSVGHVFLTSDWQYLISCCLRLPVKLLRQRIKLKIGFFMVVLHSHEAHIAHTGRYSSQRTRASRSSVRINCSRDNLKDKSEKKGFCTFSLFRLILWQTYMFM